MLFPNKAGDCASERFRCSRGGKINHIRVPPLYRPSDRLAGLEVKASASGTEDPEFDSRLRRGDFSVSSHTSD